MSITLEDLIHLGACALLGASTRDGGTFSSYNPPSEDRIKKAVDDSQRVWKEVVKRRL